MKVYVSALWSALNDRVVERLRAAGHDVYESRRPALWIYDFDCAERKLRRVRLRPKEFCAALLHTVAIDGFQREYEALEGAEVCVLIRPGGDASHLAAGFMAGRGKPLLILARYPQNPELMYRLGRICTSIDELLDELEVVRAEAQSHEPRLAD
jgi:hypothetical protein